MTNQNQMKIKAKALAVESRMQRNLQRSIGRGIAWGKGEGSNEGNLHRQLGVSQAEHAKLRVKARHLHLARMLRKGTPYNMVEDPINSDVDSINWETLKEMANVSEVKVFEYLNV